MPEQKNPIIKKALVSVSDKTSLKEFCSELSKLDIEIISTGGTLKFLVFFAVLFRFLFVVFIVLGIIYIYQLDSIFLVIAIVPTKKVKIPPAGLEPATSRLEVGRAIQLRH